eukprot:TRINITY_DN122409_c0_g1_i1.p1 TRINITY_DN122409_c0_g1~~TRINITY_DN122409_c0_g1_i1.p1  ORF type:complete len:403 (-),score=69.04 TRINITY_DN122409_c0_g1_i1:220-1428(-)
MVAGSKQFSCLAAWVAAATLFVGSCGAVAGNAAFCDEGQGGDAETCRSQSATEDVETQAMKQMLLQKRAKTNTNMLDESLVTSDDKVQEDVATNGSDAAEGQDGWDKCEYYMKHKGCGWTKTYSCPGQHTPLTKGKARTSGTGYECCCKKEGWKTLETQSTVSTSAADEKDKTAKCADYVKKESCAWTKTWNCPGQTTPTSKGHAHADSSLGYDCCCNEKLWQKLPTPAPTPAPLPGSYWNTGFHRNMTVYHQTSPQVCELIMKSNFIIGKGGLCGKAVYFAVRPQDTKTKAITAGSHGGCMIEAVVDVGKTGRFLPPDGGWRKWVDGQKEKPCGGYSKMTGKELHSKGYDTIIMRRGDGDEVIVFEPERILEKKIIPFKCEWMCGGKCQKHWPSHCHKSWR